LFDQFLFRRDGLEPVLEMPAADALAHVRARHVVEHSVAGSDFRTAHLIEVGVLEIDHDMQPSFAIRSAIRSITSLGVESTSRLDEVKRTPARRRHRAR